VAGLVLPATVPLAQMTLAQKVSILHGNGNGNASPYIGNVTGIPSLCIPNLGLQDGPAGVGDGLGGVTQMPSGNASVAAITFIWTVS
jgi:beta-glucosidase